jgi:hypothetical protein
MNEATMSFRYFLCDIHSSHFKVDIVKPTTFCFKILLQTTHNRLGRNDLKRTMNGSLVFHHLIQKRLQSVKRNRVKSWRFIHSSIMCFDRRTEQVFDHRPG